MKKTIALLLALVMLFGLVACGEKAPADTGASQPADTGASQPADTGASQPDDTQTPADKEPVDASHLGPIKIGHICDLTGVEALTGKEAQAAMDFAVEYVGKICNREIEIIHRDSQSNPSLAVDAARVLIEDDGVDLIVGPNLIGHKAAVANFAQTAGVPILFYSATPAGMIQAGGGWVLGVAGATPQLPTAMADYVWNELKYDAVVTLTKDDSGGKSYMDPFTTNYTAMGGKVLSQAWAPAEDNTDYAAYLMSLAEYADEADCLVAWTSASSAIQLWQAWYQLGMHETLPMVAVFHGAFTDSFICDALTNINPALVEEILGTVAPMTWGYNLDNEANKAFVEASKAANDGAYPIGNNMPGGTVQVMLLVKAAIEALDGVTSDHEALRDAMLAADIQGPEGRTFFAEGSYAATKDIYIVKVVKLEDGSYNYEMVKTYPAMAPEGLTP